MFIFPHYYLTFAEEVLFVSWLWANAFHPILKILELIFYLYISNKIMIDFPKGYFFEYGLFICLQTVKNHETFSFNFLFQRHFLYFKTNLEFVLSKFWGKLSNQKNTWMISNRLGNFIRNGRVLILRFCLHSWINSFETIFTRF